jgi:ankyrin repeat protein
MCLGCIALKATAAKGNLDFFRLLLEKGVDLNATAMSNQQVLQAAVIRGNLDIVQLLCERDIVNRL